MALTIDRQEYLIEMSPVPGARPATPEFIGIVLSELAAPLTDGFVGHDDATFKQEFCHISVAETEARVSPDGMTDNLTGEAMTFVRIGGGQGRHDSSIA